MVDNNKSDMTLSSTVPDRTRVAKIIQSIFRDDANVLTLIVFYAIFFFSQAEILVWYALCCLQSAWKYSLINSYYFLG